MSVLAAFSSLDDATDGQLLGRFVLSRDADAFAALVRRLGPTVLAVCRRVCPDAHLAEDAFQAAFLVLAKKADGVRPREQVAVWLHGVAYRTASKARAMLANRRRRETEPVDLPDPSTIDPAVPDDELRKLDAAIAALPKHLRAAVVLCELEGRSRKDAAKQLGIPEGTLSSRLADARKRLGERLRPTVAAVVTAALAASTAEAVVSGSTSETVRFLARGVMSMMLWNRLKLPAALLLVAVAALSGGTVALLPSPAPASAAPVPKEKDSAGVISVTREGVVYLLTPEGKETHKIDIRDRLKGEMPGKSLVHVTGHPTPKAGFPLVVEVGWHWKEGPGDRIGKYLYQLRVFRSADDPKGEVIDFGDEEFIGEVLWPLTGGKLYARCLANDADKKRGWTNSVKYLTADPTTGKATASVLPDFQAMLGEAADGGVITLGHGDGPELPWPLHRLSADGRKSEELKPTVKGWPPMLRLAPDGHTILHRIMDGQSRECTLVALDAFTGKKTTITPQGLTAEKLKQPGVFMHSVRWSPDGKRIGIIYSIGESVSSAEGGELTLHVCDRDGSNGADIFSWTTNRSTWYAFEWN